MTFAATEKGKQMVKEYIEREALISEFKRLKLGENSFIERVFADGVYAIIEQFPAADVAPVQHGRWTFGKDLPDSFGSMNKNKYHLYCSECRHQAFNNSDDNDCDFDMDTPFCPWCGAKMDKEEEQ